MWSGSRFDGLFSLFWKHAAILNEYVTFAEWEGTAGEGLGAILLKSGRRISAKKHHKTAEWTFFVDADQIYE
jgi:hypothetical protein